MPEQPPFPLVGLEAVADAQQQWAAVAFRVPAGADPLDTLLPLFTPSDTQAAFAPLDFIIPLPEPRRFQPAQMTQLPTDRTVFEIPAAALAEAPVRKHCDMLASHGYRLLVDGDAGILATEAGARGVVQRGQGMPSALSLLTLPGPHWARDIADGKRLSVCRAAGMQWFSGDYMRRRDDDGGDGTSRKRLLSLLGMLARDADSRELETLLKEDPALSYHLLKVVNSAAFGLSKPIHNFGQAINVLGRRQLQRWLQLLLYARPQQDGGADPLLAQAALRAAQMESLCKLQGGDRDRQDMAFVVGVFALLDVLLAMPMADIVAALNLDLEVVGALLDRTGPFGQMLALVEQSMPDPEVVAALGLTNEQFWHSQLHGWHWAIQVSRNL
jgi:EAL and modified HD-GYP domain-containing signal transduction protein